MNANIEHKSATQTAVTTPRMNGEDRRHEIHKAAFHLFAKNGFRGTTTKEIASAAGVSEASLFQYFKAKAELYAAVLEIELNNLAVGDWLDEIDRCAERRDDEKLFNLVAANILEKSRSNPDFLRLMLYSALEGHESAKLLYEHHSNRLCKILVNYIERRQAEKVFQPCDAAVAAQVFIGAQIHLAITEMFAVSDRFDHKSGADFTRLTLTELRA